MSLDKLKKYKDLTEKYFLEKEEFEIYSISKRDNDETFLENTLEDCMVMNSIFLIILIVLFLIY